MSRTSTHAETEAISAAAARWVARRDAGLNTAEKGEFERWLAADARHAAAIQHYSTTWSVFDRPRRAGATSAVLREISERARRRRSRRMQTAGAGIAVLVVLVALWQRQRGGEPMATPTLPANVVLLQPERRVLPDGSIVELKAGTEIAVAFADALRRVELKHGEAHFQVAKNAARPFVVSASGVEIRAVGTGFAVQFDRKAVQVLVTEGQVAVEKTARPTTRAVPGVPAPAPVSFGTLGAGNRIVVDLASPPGTPAPPVEAVLAAELYERLAWRSPRLEFSGTPLAKAIALMNRSNGSENDASKIRLMLDPASPGLAEEPVSGLFRADNAEAFVHMLELSLGIRAERRGEQIILYKAQ